MFSVEWSECRVGCLEWSECRVKGLGLSGQSVGSRVQSVRFQDADFEVGCSLLRFSDFSCKFRVDFSCHFGGEFQMPVSG